ncbi:hypothetical protein [Caballeronia glebae]|uniref:hypothetical protein n=1 Tax=Caballeronia glebae TaxID=1777143 RepID=UPI0038B88586
MSIQNYLNRMARATGRKVRRAVPKKTRVALPDEVQECLDGISCVLRHSDPDDGQRVVVNVPMMGSFVLGGKAAPDDAEKRVKAAFPDLSDEQVKRAADRIRLRASNTIRAIQAPDLKPSRWLDNY